MVEGSVGSGIEIVVKMDTVNAVILQYLAEGSFVSAPVWEADKLLNSISGEKETVSVGKKIDEGGRPVD